MPSIEFLGAVTSSLDEDPEMTAELSILLGQAQKVSKHVDRALS